MHAGAVQVLRTIESEDKDSSVGSIQVQQPAFIGFMVVFFAIAASLGALNRNRYMLRGPGWWSLGFLLNGIGFGAWAIAAGPKYLFDPWFVVGDFVHLLGFIALLTGTLWFVGAWSRGMAMVGAGALLLWVVLLFAARAGTPGASVSLQLFRSLLFIGAGVLVLRYRPGEDVGGRALAGWSLILWAVQDIGIAVLESAPMYRVIAIAVLVSFHVSAAMGMVVMVVDRYREKLEMERSRADTLEILLPICASCKRIRTEDDRWERIEAYISKRAGAHFSHGLCPDCMAALYPDLAPEG